MDSSFVLQAQKNGDQLAKNKYFNMQVSQKMKFLFSIIQNNKSMETQQFELIS